MNYDSHSEQERSREPEERTPAEPGEVQLTPMEALPEAPEAGQADFAPEADSAAEGTSLPALPQLDAEPEADEADAPVQLQAPGGTFAAPEAPEEETTPEEESPVTYHGKFSAAPAYSQEDNGEEPTHQEQDEACEFASSASYDESGDSHQPPQYTGEQEPPEAPAPQPRGRTRAVRKGRPRRKKGEGLLGIPNILASCIWACLVLLVSVTLGRLAWVCASEILAFGREDKTITITVYENDTIDDITNKLADNELIRYPGLFKLYASFAVDDGDIKPGIWDLNTKYDYHALVKMMSPSSSRDVVKVMIPEGYSCRQIFALLEENKVCTVQDIEAYAASGELNDYWFLDGVARGDRYCLEGFLFPDTYEFYQNDSPKSILTRMLNNFDTRFDEDLRGKIQTLNAHLTDLMRRDGKTQDYIDSHLFTVRDVVNVASMIEKETSSAEEGYTIASVIYNRLFCWHGNPAYLNIDATIIYALNGKTDLTAEDLRVNSPYNTYTNTGLTPGPISNPGLNSLRAALEPSDTNYYFYVLDPTAGTHVFATTQEEHDANRARLGV